MFGILVIKLSSPQFSVAPLIINHLDILSKPEYSRLGPSHNKLCQIQQPVLGPYVLSMVLSHRKSKLSCAKS